MSESSVNMKFVAQTADAQKRIADLEKEVAKLRSEAKASSTASASASSSLGGIGSSAVSAAAGIATATAAIKVFVSAAKECVEAYREQELSETRLNAVLKATGNQAGMTTKDLLELASATQQVTRFGDEAIIEAEKILIATQALDEDGLRRAVATSADLAEAMGTDIPSAASTLAFALQDPTAGLTRLRRQGIAFTEEEIEQVKALQEANDLYGAQAVVLEKVESKYKGVAKAVGDTPTGTLDKIKNVWSDIKQGFGKGLLDAINPALDRLYKRLEDISAWINSVSTGKDSEILSKIYKARGTGNDVDLSGYTTAQLISAFDIAEKNSKTLADDDNFISSLLGHLFPTKGIALYNYASVYSQIGKELAQRGYYSISDARNGILGGSSGSSESTIWDEGSVPESGEKATPWSFIGKNSSASRTYQAAAYQDIIDEAARYRTEIEKWFTYDSKTGKWSYANGYNFQTLPAAEIYDLFGNPESITPDEIFETYQELGEIIDTTTEKKNKLFETSETADWLPTDYLLEYNTAVEHLKAEIESVDGQIKTTTDPATLQYLEGIKAGLQDDLNALTEVHEEEEKDPLGDYIREHASLSATAQAAMLDAQIAEAEMWLAAAEEGSQEKKILEEITAELKKQRDALGETETAWARMQKKLSEILNEWSPVVNKIQGMTSAVVEFQTQLWNSQADAIEDALERDKKAGDLSEQEEEERLAQINELRRKSFEAEKTNSIASAMINGALAVTQCLAQMGPVAGTIAAGLVAATTAVQVATIASQQYTPMAKGGIVTQATPIIAGEAGPEAIIPLSGGRGQQYLGNTGSVVINITIQGNADEEVVFHAIERAQRTGYLPKWSYA